MENCLVTNLKGSVENDTLQKLGCIELICESSEGDSISNRTFILIAKNGDVIVDSDTQDGFLNSAGTEISYHCPHTIAARDTITTFRNGIGHQHAIIKNKYGLNTFNVLTTTSKVRLKEGYEYTSVFKHIPELSSFAYPFKIEGNLEDFVYIGLTNLLVSNVAGNEECINGDITHFSDRLQLVYFVSSYQNNVVGDIAELADAMVANGRVSGKLFIRVEHTSCTNKTGSGKLRTYVNFTNDLSTYPRGWYETSE